VTKILLIGAGGFLGAVARYGMAGMVQTLSRSASFPYGTLAVNLVGCMLIGVLSQLIETRGAFTPETRAFLIIGVLGGFTTFSAFGNETMSLLRDAEPWLASANVIAHVVLGIGGVWLGRVAAFLVWG
jgi:CrcB protein